MRGRDIKYGGYDSNLIVWQPWDDSLWANVPVVIEDFAAHKRSRGAGEYALIDIRVAQISSIDFSPQKTCPTKVGPTKINASQICITKVSFERSEDSTATSSKVPDARHQLSTSSAWKTSMSFWL